MLELLLLVLSKKFVMEMWKEVFNVDDGDIRLYNDPEHREFLASVMKGEIPQELRREARGGDVTVGMKDHRNEEFVKPGVKPNTTQEAGNVIQEHLNRLEVVRWL